MYGEKLINVSYLTPISTTVLMGCLSLALVLLHCKLSVYVDMSPKEAMRAECAENFYCGSNPIFPLLLLFFYHCATMGMS